MHVSIVSIEELARRKVIFDGRWPHHTNIGSRELKARCVDSVRVQWCIVKDIIVESRHGLSGAASSVEVEDVVGPSHERLAGKVHSGSRATHGSDHLFVKWGGISNHDIAMLWNRNRGGSSVVTAGRARIAMVRHRGEWSLGTLVLDLSSNHETADIGLSTNKELMGVGSNIATNCDAFKPVNVDCELYTQK